MIDPSTDAGVDFHAMMNGIFRAGASVGFSGSKGGGKSHSVVAFNEYMVLTHPNAVFLTNMVFLRFKGTKEVEVRGQWRRMPDFEGHKYPKGVIHVTTLEQVFRITGKLLADDPDVLILIALDEVQNFILADLAREDLVITFYRYAGNARKFRHVDEYVTPSLANLPPRLRTFNDDPRAKGGGYLDVHFYKSRWEVDEYNRAWGTSHTPKEMSCLKISFDHRAELVEVPVTNWTKPWTWRDWSRLKPGDYLYDHLASAIFRLGDGFRFEDLILKIGDMPSMDVPSGINEFFDGYDDENPLDDPELEFAREVFRARERNVKWKDLAYIFDKPSTTLQSILERHPELASTEGG